MPIREVNDKWIEVTQDTNRTVPINTSLTLQLRKFEPTRGDQTLVLISDPWRDEQHRELLTYPLDLLMEALTALKAVDNGGD